MIANSSLSGTATRQTSTARLNCDRSSASWLNREAGCPMSRFLRHGKAHLSIWPSSSAGRSVVESHRGAERDQQLLLAQGIKILAAVSLPCPRFAQNTPASAHNERVVNRRSRRGAKESQPLNCAKTRKSGLFFLLFTPAIARHSNKVNS